MAFIVETGTASANATSYLSVADADAYLAIDANASSKWGALTPTNKENYLMWATRIVDQKCNFNGALVDDAQGLRWPRKDIIDRDGRAVADDVVPQQIKALTCEVVKLLLNGTDPTSGQDTERLKRTKVDVIEIEYQDDSAQSNTPSIFNSIISGLGRWVAIGRGGSARITKAG